MPSFSLKIKNSLLVVLQLLITCSNKSFLTNILSAWTFISGVISLLYFKVDLLPCLLKILSHPLSVSTSESLILIQKYSPLLSTMVSKTNSFCLLFLTCLYLALIYRKDKKKIFL